MTGDIPALKQQLFYWEEFLKMALEDVALCRSKIKRIEDTIIALERK